jgi:hypothetical protein
MPMPNGLWAVEFLSPAGASGTGVVVFRDGQICGGDSSYYYYGEYGAIPSTNTFRGRIKIKHHSGPQANIFGPVDEFHLNIEFSVREPWIMGQGVDPASPHRRVSLRLKYLETIR